MPETNEETNEQTDDTTTTEATTGAGDNAAGDVGALDDRGTDAAAGLALLRRLRDEGFESDDEKLALTLGRPAAEVAAWMGGTGEPPDDDIIMKARGIAQQRGIEIE